MNYLLDEIVVEEATSQAITCTCNTVRFSTFPAFNLQNSVYKKKHGNYAYKHQNYLKCEFLALSNMQCNSEVTVMLL